MKQQKKKYTLLLVAVIVNSIYSFIACSNGDLEKDVNVNTSLEERTTLAETTTQMSTTSETLTTVTEETSMSEQLTTTVVQATTEQPTTTEAPTTTVKPTTTEVPTTIEQQTTMPKYTGTVYEFSDEVVEEYKYGLILSWRYRYRYFTYSDGSKAIDNAATQKLTTVDATGYNATDEQLMAEAKAQVAEYQAYFEEVLRLVNELRVEAGVAPLTLDYQLNVVACIRALEMDYIDDCSHKRGDGREWSTAFDVYPELKSNRRGENIAAGIKKPERVVEAWKNSKAHYENMISPAYTKMGIGYSNECPAGYAHYWSQLFTD